MRRKKRYSILNTARAIVTVVILLAAVRWTTVYDDAVHLRATMRRLGHRLEYIEARRRGVPDWAIQFRNIFKGRFE